MVGGGVSIGQAIATYSVAVGNGPRLSHEGGIDFEAKGGDDNSNKALSGRLGFLPLHYFEVGGSFLVADVSGVAEWEEGGDDHGDEGGGDPLPVDMGELLPTNAKVKLWGADAAYTRGPWDIRGEYLNATRNSINSVSDETVVCLRESGPMNLLVSALKEELRHGETSQAGRNYCKAA